MLSVREIELKDVDALVRYWIEADAKYLTAMGADIAKIPPEEDLRNMLSEPLSLPYEEKKSYCIIWEEDGEAVGHSNINKIIFGEEAYMHLHLWNAPIRRKGMGTPLLKMTLPYYFENYKLKSLYCEPYALNPAPNKTLPKAGFTFVKEYVTIPGYLNFEQPVKRWELSYNNYLSSTYEYRTNDSH